MKKGGGKLLGHFFSYLGNISAIFIKERMKQGKEEKYQNKFHIDSIIVWKHFEIM